MVHLSLLYPVGDTSFSLHCLFAVVLLGNQRDNDYYSAAPPIHFVCSHYIHKHLPGILMQETMLAQTRPIPS
jgi:hypothetical protein